jgi:hypothetical protein
MVRLRTLFFAVVAALAGCATDDHDAVYDNEEGTDCGGKCDSADQTGFFLATYDEARTRFRATAAELAAAHPGAEVGNYAVPSATDSDLTTDFIYLPATGTPEKLVIFTSGVHGAEAFVGSAVQEMLMRRWLPTANLEHTGVLFVHSLNPWGHRHRRRVTEQNVDLNRNLSIDPKLYESKNDGYRDLDAFLNPTHPVSAWDVNTDLFELLAELVKHGPTALRDATLLGQYEFDKGIYFGGFEPVPQKASMEELFRRMSAPYKAVFLMDLHTGYGERGKLHYFGDAGPRSGEAMKTVFEGFPIDSAETNPDFYATNGDMVVWLGGILPETTTYIGTTLEYGTLDSQTKIGGIRSLQRMRLENQGFQFGFSSERTKRGVLQRFADMFDPPDSQWRAKIIATTADVVPVLVQRFQALPSAE